MAFSQTRFKKNKIDKLQMKVCEWAGRRFNYHVRFEVKVGGQLVFSITTQLACDHVRCVSDWRTLKLLMFGNKGIAKKFPELKQFLPKRVPPMLRKLNPGLYPPPPKIKIYVEPIMYLGWY